MIEMSSRNLGINKIPASIHEDCLCVVRCRQLPGVKVSFRRAAQTLNGSAIIYNNDA